MKQSTAHTASHTAYTHPFPPLNPPSPTAQYRRRPTSDIVADPTAVTQSQIVPDSVWVGPWQTRGYGQAETEAN
ncbi:unnamed protein product [Camellia sinensis]